MADNQNKKYVAGATDVTEVGLLNILNTGGDKENPEYVVDPVTGAVSLAGPSKTKNNIPAIITNIDSSEDGTTVGLSSLQAEEQAKQEGYAPQKESFEKLASVSKELGIKDYYNEAGALAKIGIENFAVARTAAKTVQDVVKVGIGQGAFASSIKNSLAETSWKESVLHAVEYNDPSFDGFKRMGIYHKSMKEANALSPAESKESFADFAFLTSGMLGKASLDILTTLKKENLRVREENGTFRVPTKEEMAWFEKYQNLIRTRIAYRNTNTIQETFNEEFAESVSWADEYLDVRGEKYSQMRKYSEVAGAAAGSALMFELAYAGPSSLINFGSQAVRASGVMKAISTSQKMWRGSVLTNPYLLSTGGGAATSAAANSSLSTLAFMQQFNETKAEALAAGWDPATANRIAGLNAGVQTLIETVSFDRFIGKYLMGGHSFKRFLMKGAIPEGAEEVAQTLTDEAFTNYFGIKKTSATELGGNLWMSFVGGVAGSGLSGGIHWATNTSATLLSGDFKKLMHTTDPKTSTRDWLKQMGVDTTKIENRISKNAATKAFEDYLSKQAGLPENQPVADGGITQQSTEVSKTPEQQTLGVEGQKVNKTLVAGEIVSQEEKKVNEWGQFAITGMTNAQKNAFDEFCKNNNLLQNTSADGEIDSNELNEALLKFTGNTSIDVSALSEEDAAKAKLDAVMTTLNSTALQVDVKEELEKGEPISAKEKDLILNTIKKEVKRRAKEINPKITKKQLDNLTSLISKLITDDMETGELSSAISEEALNDVVTTGQEAVIRAEKTKQDVFKAAKKANSLINPETLKTALTGNGLERYNSLWDLATQILENRYTAAIGDREAGKAIASLIKQTYYNALLSTTEVNPFSFVMAAAPNVLTARTLRRREIRINGLEGIDSKIIKVGPNYSPSYIKATSALLAKQMLDYQRMEDGTEKEQLAESILYGLFGENAAGIKIEDALDFISNVAYEEVQIHRSIGSGSITNNMSLNDILSMAIMRLKGLSEAQILYSFGVQDKQQIQNVVNSYWEVIDALYPKIPINQLQALNNLGKQIIAKNAVGQVKGAFIPDTGKQGKTSNIFLSENANGKVIGHETAHWIWQLSRDMVDIAKTNALFALGSFQNSPDKLFFNSSIADLYTDISMEIAQNEKLADISEDEMSETFAEILTDYLFNYSRAKVSQNTLEAFQSLYTAQGSQENPVGSRFNDLTPVQKSNIRKILNEKLDTKVSDYANKQIEIAQELREGLIKSLNDIDRESVSESVEYQLYKNLSKVLSKHSKESGIVNRGLAKLSKIFGAFESGKTSTLSKDTLISATLDTIQELDADGYKTVISLLSNKSKSEDLIEEEALTKTEREWLKDSQDNFSEEEDARYNEDFDVLDEILSKKDPENNPKPSDAGALFFQTQPIEQTATEKMLNGNTLKEEIKDAASLFSLKSWVSLFDSLTSSVVEYANKVHPMLGAALRATIYDSARWKSLNAETAFRWQKIFEDFNNAEEKAGRKPISNREFEIYKNMLVNHRRSRAFKFMEARMATNKEIQEDLSNMHKLLAMQLNDSYKLMLQMGFQIEEVKDYFPSIVIDREKYAEMRMSDMKHMEAITGNQILSDEQRNIGAKKYGAATKAALQKQRESKSKPIDIVNAINAELGGTNNKLSAPHLYKKKSATVGVKYNDCYADIFESFVLYNDDIATKWLYYKLVGNAEGLEEKTDLLHSNQGGILGQLMYSNLQNPLLDYNADAEDEFIRSLKWMFARKNSEAKEEKLIGALKQVQTYMTLGRLTAALNQFLEFGPTMARYGLLNAAKSFIQSFKKDNDLNIYSLGIQPLNELQRMDDSKLFKRLNNFMLTYNGFTKADILMKNTVIISALSNAQEMLARDAEFGNEDETYGQRKFHRWFDKSFPKEIYSDAQREEIKREIREGILSDNVKLYLRNSLAETQPIDIAEVPAKFNSLGAFGRYMYFLSTVSIKQMRFLMNEWMMDWKNEKKDAPISIVRFMWFACLAGIPPDYIKDLIHGRQPNLKETILYSPAQYFMINKYFISVLRDKGFSQAFATRFGVGNEFVNVISQAILNKEPWYLARLVPFAGELIDNWFGIKHKQYVRWGENLNTYDGVFNQLGPNAVKKSVDFFGWDI